jgi:hypothetical protein
MTIDASGSANDLETRVAALEQRVMVSSGKAPYAYLDGATTVTVDPLDWTRGSGWASYTTIGTVYSDPANPLYPGGVLSSAFGMPQAQKVGNMCVLSGVVKRTGATLSPGTRYDATPMFGLPTDWRPVSTVVLPCLIGGTGPDGLAAVGVGWIEVRSDHTPTPRKSGGVYFVTGTVALTAGTGWLALQGVFPCEVQALNSTDGAPVGSWNAASETLTWGNVDEAVTWNSYPYPAY